MAGEGSKTHSSVVDYFRFPGLGTALVDKGKVDEAIACFRKTIELNPKSAAAHFNMGLALHGKGKADEAIACFRKPSS